MITFTHASKHFAGPEGTVRALEDVTLSVAQGEFVAVLGASGSGKSTLLSLAGAMTLPTAGCVQVAGQDISALTALERTRLRAKSIGFVFQVFHLLPYLNVLDNVLLAANGANPAATSAGELLDRLRLSHRALHRPDQLSVGERQRVALARALLNAPRIILADEPTGNLDAENGQIVWQSLAEFCQSGGTVLLATHDHQAAAQAGRQVRLDAGRIVAKPA